MAYEQAIAVSSGTTSLHIALAAFGPGDEVIVVPYTFIASDTRLLEQTAIPVFADIVYRCGRAHGSNGIPR